MEPDPFLWHQFYPKIQQSAVFLVLPTYFLIEQFQIIFWEYGIPDLITYKLIHFFHSFISGKTIFRILDSILFENQHKTNSKSMCSNHVKYLISFLKWALLHCARTAQSRLLLRDVGTGGARDRSLPDYGISIKRTSINDVPHIFWPFLTYLPTFSYSITFHFGCYLGPPYLL